MPGTSRIFSASFRISVAIPQPRYWIHSPVGPVYVATAVSIGASRSGAAGMHRVAHVDRARVRRVKGSVQRDRLVERGGERDLAEATPNRRFVRRLRQAPDRATAQAVEALADVHVATAVKLPHGEDDILLRQVVRDRVF